jgi:hypothetical protein
MLPAPSKSGAGTSKGLPARSGFEIAATPAVLAEQANEISAALNDYVIWSRALKARYRPSELRDWYDALGR